MNPTLKLARKEFGIKVRRVRASDNPREFDSGRRDARWIAYEDQGAICGFRSHAVLVKTLKRYLRELHEMGA